MGDRICYFIQSHRDPAQIYRLVRTLRGGSPDSLIVVHHDFGSSGLDWSPFAGAPGIHLLRSSAPQIRAHFSCMAQVYLDVVAWLARERHPYDWLVNITAQDYPVTPVSEIERFLDAARCDGFLRWWDVLSSDSPWSRRKARRRYWYHYALLPSRALPLVRLLRPLARLLPIHFSLDYGPRVGIRALRAPYRREFRCYGGWAWFSLHRRAVDRLSEFLAAHPAVVAHYRRTVVPEESLVPTVLANDGELRLVNDDLRYIDYAHSVRGAPRTLTAADLPRLASGKFHFARKFDAADGALLDRIDRELLGVEPPPRLRSDPPGAR